MGFLDTIGKLLGPIGAIFGGPVGGAVGGVVGSLFEGDEAQPAAQQAQGSYPVQMTMAQAPAAGQSPGVQQAFWRGYIEQLRNAPAQKPAEGFNWRQALEGGEGQANMGQLNNRLGGMSYPRQAGAALTSLVPRGEGAGAGGGDGKGAGGTTLPGASGAAYPQSAFQLYLQRALAGQNALPETAYQRQFAQGMNAVNAQAMQSRSQLGEQLGARGMLHSGLMGTGLRGVEESRLGAVGGLASGLAQQQLEATRASQQYAAGLVPSIMGIQETGLQRAQSGFLSMKQLELEAQRIGLSQQQIDAFENANDLAAYVSMAKLGVDIFGRKTQATTPVSAQPYSGVGNVAPGWPAGGYDYLGNYTPYG